MGRFIFNCRDLAANSVNELEENGFRIQVYHAENDPASANRVKVSTDLVELELLPSKGFSLGQAWINGQQIFWDAPIGLPDTENIDLWSDEIKINGNPALGFTFLKTLTAGVELYGLKNWGMPVTTNGQLCPIHGETSNIPVSEIQFKVENENKCTVQASFIYRTFKGNADLPWYERGTELFKVTKKVILHKDSFEILVEDTIENISDTSQIPDWGYHITFRPEENSKFIVPSRFVQERGSNPLPNDIETWHKATDEKVRIETGIVHKELFKINITNSETVTSLLKYPNNTGIAITVPASPYFQTWFCSGGKGSKEFTNSNNDSLLHKNWDGIGIEIGSSALDHNGDIDESVKYLSELKSGERKTIQLKFQYLDNEALKSIENEIIAYNKDRNLK